MPSIGKTGQSLVGVPSLEEARERCIEPIEALGYNYVPEYASWIPGELFFRKGPPGPWTHHVHLMEPSYPRWDALLVFRDYLFGGRPGDAHHGDLATDHGAAAVYTEANKAFGRIDILINNAGAYEARPWICS